MARIKEKMNKFSTKTSEIMNPATIDMISNKEAIVCGCRGVIEYDENTVKVNCGTIIVFFQGMNLSIKALSIEEIIVSGEIMKIEFSNC